MQNNRALIKAGILTPMTKRRTRPTKRSRNKNTSRSKHSRSLFKLLILYSFCIAFVAVGLWVLYLDHVVRDKFDGKKWALPARVYARPLELYEGLPITPNLLERELNALGYRWVDAVSKPGQSSRHGAGEYTRYQVYTRGFDFWDGRDRPQKFEVVLGPVGVARLLSDGSALPLARLEPEQIGGIYPTQKEDRLLVQLKDLPPLLGETLLAVEDKNFLRHWGVSPTAIARAAWVNFRSGQVVQGGSTLTQQLVKNFYLSHERSLARKAQEAAMSVLLELHYSKAEILETYINEVFLGQSGARAIHGFGLAAQHYFQVPVSELDTPKVALLVGLVKGASYYNPWRNPERAKKRRNLVLGVMHREGLISSAELNRAQAAPLGVVKSGSRSQTTYPAFVDLVKRQLARDYKTEDLQSEGLRIFTTLSPMVQRQAEDAVAKRLANLEQAYNTENLQAAMVVTSVGAGEVLAVVGDKNPRYAGFNRALDAHRQIGSLMKPLVYLSALEQPARYHLGTLISDDPVTVTSDDGQLWQPQNYSRQSHGEVPLLEALVRSYNQATARLGMQLGLQQVAYSLERAGFSGHIPAVPAMTLGAVDMSPIEVAGIYHTLAAEGTYTPLRAIRDVLTATGEPLKRYPLTIEQRFSEAAAFQIQYALQAVLREGTGRAVYHRFPADLPLAGKTGTTNDQRDSWFAGFSGQHLAVSWVGRDDNSPMPLTGSGGALKVWADLMSQLPTRGVNLTPPESVSFDWIDARTGLLSAEGCEGALWLPMVTRYTPSAAEPCRLQQKQQERSWWHRFWN
ncbi:penicillin-binding protein 1B [Gilvimarinus sp. SDUM040013]|uniref:Penicillin-binding protein 1B n=1 Tax=Gilvimarinus gilvus TaxID=3058038 RepID=A0ABU4RZQ4_9GAMM|nr:penicillin-binding protein 1B [Gilvimarinus sp. SDUM040013]MDO3386079.1 penicillin-binding protein 1B [Gilvimarinus sp. SDUM040013]MDX6850380.1 penicillin-binding protein 1B [Gilvimarinus sp. SDUM040013]